MNDSINESINQSIIKVEGLGLKLSTIQKEKQGGVDGHAAPHHGIDVDGLGLAQSASTTQSLVVSGVVTRGQAYILGVQVGWIIGVSACLLPICCVNGRTYSKMQMR